MSKTLIIYHCRLHNPPLVVLDHSIPIMVHQMRVLADSGLADAASEFIIGTNGDTTNFSAVSMLAPKQAKVVDRGPDAHSELSTIAVLREWLPGHEDWIVFSHHSKCATRHDPLCVAWRGCMEKHLVHDWRECVRLLEAGFESVGCHWMTPERWGKSLLPSTTPYWGGNFWWAKASFLMTLPTLPESARPDHPDDRFIAENWIGLGPRRPQVYDYHPNWPSLTGCAAHLK